MEGDDVIYVDSTVPSEYNQRVSVLNCEVVILTNLNLDGYYLIYYKPYYYTEFVTHLPDTLETTGVIQYVERTDKPYYRTDVVDSLIVATLFLAFIYFIIYSLFRGIFRRS